MRFSSSWLKWLFPVVLIQKKVLTLVPFSQGQILASWYVAAAWTSLALSRPKRAFPGLVFGVVLSVFCFQQVIAIWLKSFHPDVMAMASACIGIAMPLLLFNLLFKVLSDKFRRNYHDTTDQLIRSVQISFWILLPFMILQALAAYGFSPAATINNILAPIYEARWDPFANSKSDVHFFYREGSYATSEFRINGTFEETPNLMLAFATIYLPFALAGLRHGLRGSTLFFSLAVVFLVISKSSSGLLMAAMAITVAWWIRKSWRIGISIGAISTLVALPLLYSSIVDSDLYVKYIAKMTNMDNTSTNTRSASILVAFGMIQESPIWGWGRQLYHEGASKYVPSFSYDNWEVQAYLDNGKFHIYNIPLLLMVEYGVPLAVGSLACGGGWFALRFKSVSSFDPYMADLFKYFIIFFAFSMTFMGTYFLFQYFVPLAIFAAAFSVIRSNSRKGAANE